MCWQAYDELAKKLRELDALNGISGLLGWDELVGSPISTLNYSNGSSSWALVLQPPTAGATLSQCSESAWRSNVSTPGALWPQHCLCAACTAAPSSCI